MATVVIGADICPIEGNRPYFKAGDARNLFNDLLPEFTAADLTIANLECPLIRKPSPIFKTGPVFGEDNDCINGDDDAAMRQRRQSRGDCRADGNTEIVEFNSFIT